MEQVGLRRQFTEVIYFDNICYIDTVVKPNKKVFARDCSLMGSAATAQPAAWEDQLLETV